MDTFKTVAAYFAALDPGKRSALGAFRKTLKKLLPKAEEVISYGMPAFRHPGGVVVYYAAMKNHLSFFPTSYPIEACKADLKGYPTSRGTIRFPVDEPLPASLVKKLVRVRLEQMAEKAGGAKPKLNKEWHAKHRMPAGATLERRAEWHKAHAAACGCRPMPDTVKKFLAKGKT